MMLTKGCVLSESFLDSVPMQGFWGVWSNPLGLNVYQDFEGVAKKRQAQKLTLRHLVCKQFGGSNPPPCTISVGLSDKALHATVWYTREALASNATRRRWVRIPRPTP